LDGIKNHSQLGDETCFLAWTVQQFQQLQVPVQVLSSSSFSHSSQDQSLYLAPSKEVDKDAQRVTVPRKSTVTLW